MVRDIKLAETKRRDGDYEGAIAIVQPAVEYPLTRYASWGNDRRLHHLQSASLFVGAVKGLVESSETAPEVAHHLERQREAIVTVYRNPQVKEEAKKQNMDESLLRDEIWYMTTLSALTGNTEIVNGAIAKMDELIERVEHPSEKAVVVFDKHRLLYENDPTKDQFRALTVAFRNARRKNTQTKDWHQVATLAARYGLHSIERRLEAIYEAQKTYNIALMEDGSVEGILDQETKASFKGKIRHSQWRRTIPEGADYSSLALPVEPQTSVEISEPL